MSAPRKQTNRQMIMSGTNNDRSVFKAGGKLGKSNRKKQIDLVNTAPRSQRRKIVKQLLKTNQGKR